MPTTGEIRASPHVTTSGLQPPSKVFRTNSHLFCEEKVRRVKTVGGRTFLLPSMGETQKILPLLE